MSTPPYPPKCALCTFPHRFSKLGIGRGARVQLCRQEILGDVVLTLRSQNGTQGCQCRHKYLNWPLPLISLPLPLSVSVSISIISISIMMNTLWNTRLQISEQSTIITLIYPFTEGSNFTQIFSDATLATSTPSSLL